MYKYLKQQLSHEPNYWIGWHLLDILLLKMSSEAYSVNSAYVAKTLKERFEKNQFFLHANMLKVATGPLNVGHRTSRGLERAPRGPQ